jgi:dCMP deaminase
MEFTKQDYEYMKIAEELAETSPCIRNKVGAAVVKDGKVLLSAANGIVAGVKCCADIGGCLRNKYGIKHAERLEICYAPCAETRCVCEAARDGIPIKGATVYCSQRPCIICTRVLAAAEVAKVIYKTEYSDPNSAAVAKAIGLSVVQLK